MCFVPRSFDDDYESEELQVPGEIGNKMEKLVISDLTAWSSFFWNSWAFLSGKKNKQEQSDQSDRRSLCIKIYIYGCKDRERKNDFGICLSKTLESPQNGLNQFLCVCVTVKPALFYIWCNNASVSIQKEKQKSLPPALRSTWEVKVKQRGGRSVW